TTHSFPVMRGFPVAFASGRRKVVKHKRLRRWFVAAAAACAIVGLAALGTPGAALADAPVVNTGTTVTVPDPTGGASPTSGATAGATTAPSATASANVNVPATPAVATVNASSEPSASASASASVPAAPAPASANLSITPAGGATVSAGSPADPASANVNGSV